MLVTPSNHAPFVDPNLPRTLPLGALGGDRGGRLPELGAVHRCRARRPRGRLRASEVLDGPCSSSTAITTASPDGAGDRAARAARAARRRVAPARGAGAAAGAPPRRASRGRAQRPGGPGRRRADDRRSARPTARADLLPRTQPRLRLAASGGAPDGSAVSEELVLLGREARWGPPGCLDAATGAPVARERCDALAEYAARELAISRAEVDQDPFRWMPSPVANAGPGERHLANGGCREDQPTFRPHHRGRGARAEPLDVLRPRVRGGRPREAHDRGRERPLHHHAVQLGLQRLADAAVEGIEAAGGRRRSSARPPSATVWRWAPRA